MRYIVLLLFCFSVPAQSQTDSLAAKATAGVQDTTKKKFVADTVRFHQPKVFAKQSRIIADSTFLWNDSRYFADFLGSTGLSFNRSLGTAGQPEEVLLYGLGNGMMSVFDDGDFINNRSNKSYNFNYMQGEGVQEIELLPLSRGFLYGPFNNPVAMQTITTTGISAIPYTRVRYYQAPFLEGFLDFRQQQIFLKKLVFALHVTNCKKDEGYTASGSSSWLASLQLMYPVGKSLTLATNYRFTRFAPELNGGVDMDSIKNQYKNPETVLYDEILSPVVSPGRYYKTYQNALSFSARFKLNENFYNEAVIYTQESVTMFRMNAGDTLGSTRRLSMNQTVKTAGVRLMHEMTVDGLDITLNEGIENSTGRDTFYTGNPTYRAWYFSGSATFFPKSQIQPSVFAKLSGNKTNTLPGFGADIKLLLLPGVSVYAGVSAFQREQSLLSTEKTTFTVAEGRVDYAVSPAEKYSASVYHYRSADITGKRTILVADKNTIAKLALAGEKIEASGVAFSGYKKIGLISIEGSLSGFIANNHSGSGAQIPLVSGQAGVYYNNIHFDSSLVIKTGFNTKFFSEFTPMSYDLFMNTTYQKAGTTPVQGNADVSFFMAGEIKKRAIVYFTWENILDRTYYLTPYYPMPRRGLRFGLSWQLYN